MRKAVFSSVSRQPIRTDYNLKLKAIVAGSEIEGKPMPRMNVLNSLEQSAFESPPLFNSAERKRCFDFPLALQGIATSLRSPINQVCFLTSCGYFRATRRFYPTHAFHPRDLAFVAERCSISMDAVRLEDYSKETIARHRQLILEFCGFRTFTLAGSALLGPEIKRLVRAQVKPKTIFARSIALLVREKVEVPGYFPLATLILRAINCQQPRDGCHHQTPADPRDPGIPRFFDGPGSC